MPGARRAGDTPVPDPRHGMPSPELDEAQFKARFLASFQDQGFAALGAELNKIADAAWDAYRHSRKSPKTRKAGRGFEDPDYDLSCDWLAAREAIDSARAAHDDPAQPLRILVVNASSRSEHTCPGEISKSYRFAILAKETAEACGVSCDVLDLSRIASEYGRNIHPCKACFSTAAALCHFPCSCYPHYSLGQSQDWMNEIYPMWVRAHGVMIVTPVHWYQVSSPLKLMMDRLVCADGGNPDPTSTSGKDAKKAKALELAGWGYPRHLEGRVFSVVVHGDTEGAESVRRSLADWLRSMHLESAGSMAELDRYIGYWQPYASSHVELDRDEAIHEEVRNAARALAEAVQAKRRGLMLTAGDALEEPRSK